MRWVTRRAESRLLGTRLASLTVGDSVVYASHGLGRVTLKETRNARDVECEVVVVEFREGLSVTLPLERAFEYLRPVSDEAELEQVRRVLRGSPVEAAVWQTRLRVAQEKVAVGSAIGLAEVIRNSARRDEEIRARGNGGMLSLAERGLYQKARQLLADEIGSSRGIESAEADAWIDEQLAVGSHLGAAPSPI